MKKTLLFALSLAFILFSCGSGAESEDQVGTNDSEPAPDSEVSSETEVTDEAPEPELFYPEGKDDYSVDEALVQIRLAEKMAADGTNEPDRAKGRRAKGKWIEYLAPFPEKIEDPMAIDVVEVSTEQDLRNYVGSNKLIVLTEDNYSLGDDENYGGITGRNVENMAIIGKGKQVQVHFEMPTEPVFYMVESKNLYFGNLHAGHLQAVEWMCEEGGFVFEFEQTNSVWIENSDLFGCGVVGVRAVSCQDLTCNGSRIFDCKANAIEAIRSRGMVFRDCEIYENPTDHHLVAAYDGSQIEFHSTSFKNNHFRRGEGWADSANLIFATYDSNVGLIKCSFSGNSYDSDGVNDDLFRKGSGVVKSTESEI